MRKRLAICGTQGAALVVADAVAAMGAYELVGFIGNSAGGSEDHADAMEISCRPILGDDDRLQALAEEGKIDAVFVAIGENHRRMTVTKRLQAALSDTIDFPSILHPSATVSGSAHCESASLVLAGAVVGPGARIGAGCWVNTRASLDHHSEMMAYASLAPGVVTGGSVRIGEGSAICIGAVISQGVGIGEWSVVGAGATVVEDVPDHVVAFGVPARVVRARCPDEGYL